MESTTKMALLVMDMQPPILGNLPDARNCIWNVARAIMHARNENIPVIYVMVGFRAGAPEISSHNATFSSYREKWTPATAEQWMKIHPDLTPQPGEIVITKRRFSAFTGSDLEVVLRGLQLDHLVLTGVATSGVVLSTLREAADKDYRLTVIADCCADRDAEVHHILTTKVFPKQAEVISLEQWVK